MTVSVRLFLSHGEKHKWKIVYFKEKCDIERKWCIKYQAFSLHVMTSNYITCFECEKFVIVTLQCVNKQCHKVNMIILGNMFCIKKQVVLNHFKILFCRFYWSDRQLFLKHMTIRPSGFNFHSQKLLAVTTERLSLVREPSFVFWTFVS